MSWLGRVFAASERRERVPFADSVNCHYMVTLLVGLSVLTAFPQLVMEEPISCDPNNVTAHTATYRNKVCWSRGSFLSNVNGVVNQSTDNPANTRVFTRLPLLFLLQGFLLYLPQLVWLTAQQNPVVPFRSLINTAADWYEADDVELARSRLDFLVNRLYRFLRSVDTSTPVRRVLTMNGNYLSVCYITVKVMYVVCVMTCLSFTALIMGNFDVELRHLYEVTQGEYKSDYLPPTVMCQTMEPPPQHDGDNTAYEGTEENPALLRHVFSCTLPQNELNQMIMTALGCCFTLLLCINITALIYGVVGVAVLKWKRYDLEMYLDCSLDEQVPIRQLNDFLHKLLRRDGVFILQYVGFIASDQLTGLLLEELWQAFTDNENENTEQEMELKKLNSKA